MHKISIIYKKYKFLKWTCIYQHFFQYLPLLFSASFFSFPSPLQTFSSLFIAESPTATLFIGSLAVAAASW